MPLPIGSMNLPSLQLKCCRCKNKGLCLRCMCVKNRSHCVNCLLLKRGHCRNTPKSFPVTVLSVPPHSVPLVWPKWWINPPWCPLWPRMLTPMVLFQRRRHCPTMWLCPIRRHYLFPYPNPFICLPTLSMTLSHLSLPLFPWPNWLFCGVPWMGLLSLLSFQRPIVRWYIGGSNSSLCLMVMWARPSWLSLQVCYGVLLIVLV